MKNLFLSLAFIFVSTCLLAQKNTSIQVIADNESETTIHIELGDMQQRKVNTPLGEAVSISIPSGTPLLQKGCPNLPKLAFSVLLPNQKNATVAIVESRFTDYPNTHIAPSKGSFSRTIKPSSIPYVYDPVYTKNEFYPGPLSRVLEPYILRDFRGQTVQVFPLQYNPVTQTLRVFSSLVLRVSYKKMSTNTALSSNQMPTKIVEEFDGIYANQFINYPKNLTQESHKTRYAPITEQGSMLIICPSTYLNKIAPLNTWKQMKGIKTFLVKSDTITGGVNETNIRNLIKKYYQTYEIAYCLLVGDQINIPTYNTAWNDPGLGGPGDNPYGYITPVDHYPDLIMGRISGINSTEIETQVNKILAYEKTPHVNTDAWMQRQLGIASEQGPGDDNQYDYEHIEDIMDSNKIYYNYLHNTELFDGVASHGTYDAAGYPTAAEVTSEVNTGCSLINYCGHGGSDLIVTTNFNTGDVASLTNTNGSWPFFFVVGCQTGNFLNTNSFSEAWQRGGTPTNPTGTISSYMSVIDQLWDEPMQAQDEFNAVLRGARPNNLKSKLGAICMDACASMNDQYGTTGGYDMTDTWVYFGDPTVSLYTKNEGTLSCTHSPYIGKGSTTFWVNCPVDGATIGLYYQGKYWASANVIGGVASFLAFDSLNVLDTMYVTATKQNYTPYFGKVIVQQFPANTQNINQDNAISIYPNPTSDKLHIENKNKQTMQSIRVLDAVGKTCLQVAPMASSTDISLSNLSSGIYTILVQTNAGTVTKKVIKE